MKKMDMLLAMFFCMLSMPMLVMAQTETPTPDPESTPEITDIIIVIEPSEGQEIDPPISITLPDGWISQNGTLLIQDITGLRLLPYTVYSGDIPNGIGTIVLLWGFESIGLVNNLLDVNISLISPYMDGLRLLRLALVEPQCTVGTDVERDIPIGDQIGRGTGFAAVNCPETADTRGWFVGLTVDNLNFVFYVFADPIGAMDGAEEFLQDILETVDFRVDDFLEAINAQNVLETTPEVTPIATP